jgi:UDP-N-acetylmuramoyl-tripeptide--D-alanyl-D-alanine ligase
VGPAHIGLLGSLENIGRAKLEIAEGLDAKNSRLVINGDDSQLSRLAPTIWNGVLDAYHLSEAKDITPFVNEQAEGIRFTYKGVPVTLPVPGEHMVANALGVLKVGEALGFSVEELARGLSTFVPEKGRWERTALEGYTNTWVINDAYNANPDSAKASLKAFLSTARAGMKHILILGGMKELGDFGRAYHEELGTWLAGQANVDALFTVGEEGQWLADAAKGASFPVHFAASIDEVAAQLLNGSVPLQDAVLYLKGSRAYNLEEIPVALKNMGQQKPLQLGEAR